MATGKAGSNGGELNCESKKDVLGEIDRLLEDADLETSLNLSISECMSGWTVEYSFRDAEGEY